MATLEQEEARSVAADVVDQLVERDEVALALRHSGRSPRSTMFTSCMMGAS